MTGIFPWRPCRAKFIATEHKEFVVMNENLSDVWRGILREYEASGLSLSRFCRERSLSYYSATYWKRKFAGMLPVKRNSCGECSGDFIEIPMIHPQAPQEKLILHLNSGTVLEIPSGFDAATLRSTIAILRETRPC